MEPEPPHLVYRVLYALLCAAFALFQLTRTIYFKFTSHELKRSAPKPDKIPTHLTLLLGEEPPSYKDLANVIVWCLASGIAFVSFYERKGVLKKNEDRLREVVERTKSGADHVVWHGSACRNGYSGRKLHVKLLTADDGRRCVVELTRQFASSAANITLSDFNGALHKHYEFPDPDLGLCCGKTFSLSGYPPWQVRVTEFLSISSHHDFTFNMFLRVLRTYARCEQRYGK